MRRVLTFIGKALLHLVGVIVPLLGFWVASSITAYLNGPIWLVLLCGLLVCPVLPLIFEIWRAHQRKQYSERPSYPGAIAYSAYVDASRVAGLVLVAALVIDPKGVVAAVSTRGDWMLEGAGGAVVAEARSGVLWVADQIAFLDRSRQDNPFSEFDDSKTVNPESRGWREEKPPPEPKKAPERKAKKTAKRPAPPPKRRAKAEAPPAARRAPDAGFADSGLPPIPRRPPDAGLIAKPGTRAPPSIPEIVLHEEPEPRPSPPPKRRTVKRPEQYAYWLVSASPHHLVDRIPKSVETDWRSVASYIQRNETDAFERVKAMHDYLAVRIGYEATFDINNLPPSDPDTVFERRWAVCAGYARLFKAMVEHVGGEAVYISGRSRFAVDSLRGTTHAWNAVKIRGDWYLVDVTWDAGHVQGRRFVKKYSSDHLFPPPEVFGLTHLPAEDRWQLVSSPMSLGDFLRQPLYWPRFFAYGFELVEPTRSQITVSGAATLVVDNPKRRHLTAKWVRKAGGSAISGRCDVKNGGPQIVARCNLPSPGDYSVKLFGALAASEVHWSVAQIDVNNRG